MGRNLLGFGTVGSGIVARICSSRDRFPGRSLPEKILGLELGCRVSQHLNSLHVILNLLLDSFSRKVGGGFRKISVLGQVLNISVEVFEDLCASDMT